MQCIRRDSDSAQLDILSVTHVTAQ
jgi:hypothetical protein